MAKIKVLLIEDNRLLRAGTTALLNEQEDIMAVSSVGNRNALRKADGLIPDVILLDMGLKGRNSLKVLEMIRKQHPQAELVVMDLIPTHSEMVDFVKAGASGFITSGATLDDFLSAIRSVVKGVKTLPPTMADSLFSRIVEHALQSGKMDTLISALRFTRRERDVIGRISAGKSNKEVARELKIAVFTVKGHVRSIMDKLALHTRLELASFALTEGIVRSSTDKDPE